MAKTGCAISTLGRFQDMRVLQRRVAHQVDKDVGSTWFLSESGVRKKGHQFPNLSLSTSSLLVTVALLSSGIVIQ